MTNQDILKIKAHKYAESQFFSVDVANPELKESIETVAEYFEAGAAWAGLHQRDAYEKAEKAAEEYALNLVDSANVDAIVTPFLEGVEWFHIEVSKKWIRKEVVVDGQKGYILEARPSKLRQFFSSTAGEILIAVIMVAAIVLFLLL